MKNNMVLRRLILAALFAGMAVVIDVFFKYLIGIQNFGLPFYAIPLILGSLILGPWYGAAIAFVADLAGVLLSGQTYLPMFVIGGMLWGLLPGLLMKKQYHKARFAVVLFVTYVAVTLSNTLAMMVHFDRYTALLTLMLRVGLIFFNTIIMFVITQDIYLRMLQMTQLNLYTTYFEPKVERSA